MNSTLLLNADATPISVLPLSTKSWQQAIGFVYSGDAEPLHSYDDWQVRSPTVTMLVPAVVILKQQIAVRKRYTVGFNPVSSMVFLRDAYRCQYCWSVFPRCLLTLDHVNPRAYGGTSRWDNLTTACQTCNHTRGHNIRIQPRTRPFRPTYQHLERNLRAITLVISHPSWAYYLNWPQDRLQIICPRVQNNQSDNFDLGKSTSIQFEHHKALEGTFEHV